MKKALPGIIIVILLIGGGAFFGGMKYAQSKTPARGTFNFQNGQTLPGGATSRGAGTGAGGTRGGANLNGGAGGGFIGGEILSKDDKSITVKGMDGGSKIIFLSSSTTIMKTSNGSVEDLQVGAQVTANGSANSDGTISAQSIQIRPQMSK